MEVTKWLKPSISVSRIGDSASVQAATRMASRSVETIRCSVGCAPPAPTSESRATKLLGQSAGPS
ncbi:hypothetical protein SAMN05443247_06615 [Bradyrhizobium erythrophlei]|nr:hypothetical protein SAMN05443247_06615 [Bradyrhizobium erythrophlei]